MPLFTWTENPVPPEAANDAWWVAEVYAAAVERRKAEATAGDAT